MKAKLQTTAIVLTLLFASSAFALPYTGVTSSANVRYTLTDGVATIYGTVDSRMEKRLIEQDIQKINGVKKIRSMLFVSQ